MNSTDAIKLSTATDAELIQFCREGNKEAFGQIVERYQTLVCSVGYSRCGDVALSEDLAQEGFILAWQKLADLKDVSKFKAWICTIVRNLANRSSHRMRRTVTHAAAHLDAVPDIPSDVESPIERAVTAEQEKLVWQALTNMPEKYREPLVLFYREEQSIARVAEAMDLPEDTVKQRLSRGRMMLRSHLATVVESALVNSKPTKEFTGAVILGLSAATTKPSAAVGVTSAIASGAKSAAALGAQNGLFLGPIPKLPVIAWMCTMSWGETRSERERQLLRRSWLVGICGFVIFLAALFSSFWWRQYLQPAWLRTILPAVLMVAFLIPWIVFNRQLGKRVERLRAEDGTSTPPKPLVEPDNDRSITSKVYARFCLSAVLLMVAPAVLMLAAHDWLVFLATLASAICISLISTNLGGRLPKWSFHLYGAGSGLIVIITLCIMCLRLSVWESVFVDVFPWFVGTIWVQTTTLAILTTIAWKRVYGRPR